MGLDGELLMTDEDPLPLLFPLVNLKEKLLMTDDNPLPLLLPLVNLTAGVSSSSLHWSVISDEDRLITDHLPLPPLMELTVDKSLPRLLVALLSDEEYLAVDEDPHFPLRMKLTIDVSPPPPQMGAFPGE